MNPLHKDSHGERKSAGNSSYNPPYVMDNDVSAEPPAVPQAVSPKVATVLSVVDSLSMTPSELNEFRYHFMAKYGTTNEERRFVLTAE